MQRSPARTRVPAAVVITLLLGLVGVFVVILLSSGSPSPPAATSTTVPPPAATAGRPFSPTSIWNRPVPADAPIDASSERLIRALDAEVVTEQHEGIGPWIATKKGTTPVYIVPRGTHLTRVHLDDPTLWWRAALQRAFDAVPIPSGARPAKGKDADLVVWQPSTDKAWEFFHMRREADGWHAAWGGAIDHVSRNPGYYTPSAWPGALSQWGASASSLSVLGGLITLRDLRAGVIDHALAIDLPAPRAGVFALPAQRADGTGGPDTLPEGAHLRLDPRLDLSRLSLPPVTRMIALAAQRYGFFVRDQTHYAISFMAEDGTPYGGQRVYYGPRAAFGRLNPAQVLAKFPWNHLQVLKLQLRPVKP
jgi:hypothetical protein